MTQGKHKGLRNPRLSVDYFPLISIIIPVFNTESYLPACLNSILNQRFHDIEIVLVDDGSTDGSGELCEEYSLIDPRIVCIHQENKGVSAARNCGLDKAHGMYIWFCDSDDTLVDGSLEAIAASIRDESPLMVVFPVDQVNDDGERIGYIPAPKVSADINEGPLQLGDRLYPVSRVFQRAIALDERFDTSLSLLEDRDFAYRVTWRAAGRIAVIDKPLYRYLITRCDSAVNGSSVERYCDAVRVQENILLNEEQLGHVMPAFEQFCSFAIKTYSMLMCSDIERKRAIHLRNTLIKYGHYSKLLGMGLRVKFLLIRYCPVLFSVLARLHHLNAGVDDLGSTVIEESSTCKRFRQ